MKATIIKRHPCFFLTVCCQIDGMISVLDTSNFSILWTVPNNPYDVMGAWVPGNLSAHLGEGQWLSGIKHHMTPNLSSGCILDDLLLQHM